MARLLLFGGKGGVGKTTTSAATAIWLADSGLNVLLVSSDPAHSTSDSLGVELSSEPTLVDGTDSLYGVEMNPEGKLSALLPKMGEAVKGMKSPQLSGLSMFLDAEARQELSSMKDEVQSDELLIPGLDEALAFDELLRHMENPFWDVIIFDTAPTGHTLRFLSLPELIDTWSDRILRMIRISGGIRSMLFGRKENDELKEEIEKFRNRVLHIRRILSNPESSSFTLVTIPERMGVNETLRAHQALQRYKIPVPSCLVNRMTPNIDHPFIQKRYQEEQLRLIELKQSLEDVHVGSIKIFETEIQGLDSLREYGAILYGSPIEFEHSIGPHSFGEILHHSIHRGMISNVDDECETLHVHIPDAEKNSFQLRCESGFLFVSVNGREREIPTHYLAKKSTIRASFEGDTLKIIIPATGIEEEKGAE